MIEKKENAVPLPLAVDEQKREPEPGKTAAAPLTFRGRPIEWVEVPKTKTITHENAIGEDYIEERQSGVQHLIAYENKKLEREDFLRMAFPDYKKCPCKVNFKTDDIYRLGGN